MKFYKFGEKGGSSGQFLVFIFGGKQVNKVKHSGEKKLLR